MFEQCRNNVLHTSDMALKRKDSAVQFRIDSDTLALFQQRCDHYNQTASDALREAIRMMNAHYLKQVEKKAQP